MPTFQVVVDYKPAYELIVSYGAFVERALHRVLDLGKEWLNQVRKRLPPDLAVESGKLGKEWGTYLPLLVWLSPPGQDIPQFLQWLGGLSPANLYELIAPFSACSLPPNLGAHKEIWLHHFSTWYEAYYKSLDPSIPAGLAADAAARRDESMRLDPQSMVERATNGLHVPDLPDLKLVVLAPQYHCLPFNRCEYYRGLIIFCYPASIAPPGEHQPSAQLLRLTRALADESRLRILKLLSAGPLDFMEIVGRIGLAKSTICHHLACLRAAGLLRIHLHVPGGSRLPTCTNHYALRPGALEGLAPMLAEYVGSPAASSQEIRDLH